MREKRRADRRVVPDAIGDELGSCSADCRSASEKRRRAESYWLQAAPRVCRRSGQRSCPSVAAYMLQRVCYRHLRLGINHLRACCPKAGRVPVQRVLVGALWARLYGSVLAGAPKPGRQT